MNNLASYEFGNLLVVSRAGTKNRQAAWLCKCSCGNEKIITGSSMLRGATKSCGCLQRRRRGKEHPNWTGIGDLPSAFYHRIRNQAKERKIKFSISMKYLWALFERQNSKCIYTGRLLRLPKNEQEAGRSYEGKPSLDRIDSKKGYIKGNVQWVGITVNLMKQQFSHHEFIEMCKTIVEHNS